MTKLEHKNGGTLDSVYAIGHNTYRRVASWYYIARVIWQDGSISERCEVAPFAVCFNHDDPQARAQYAKLSTALDEYLTNQGAWLDEPRHMRDGRIVHWVPAQPQNELHVDIE